MYRRCRFYDCLNKLSNSRSKSIHKTRLLIDQICISQSLFDETLDWIWIIFYSDWLSFIFTNYFKRRKWQKIWKTKKAGRKWESPNYDCIFFVQTYLFALARNYELALTALPFSFLICIFLFSLWWRKTLCYSKRDFWECARGRKSKQLRLIRVIHLLTRIAISSDRRISAWATKNARARYLIFF